MEVQRGRVDSRLGVTLKERVFEAAQGHDAR